MINRRIQRSLKRLRIIKVISKQIKVEKFMFAPLNNFVPALHNIKKYFVYLRQPFPLSVFQFLNDYQNVTPIWRFYGATASLMREQRRSSNEAPPKQ